MSFWGTLIPKEQPTVSFSIPYEPLRRCLGWFRGLEIGGVQGLGIKKGLSQVFAGAWGFSLFRSACKFQGRAGGGGGGGGEGVGVARKVVRACSFP